MRSSTNHHRALWNILIAAALVAGLAACGGTGAAPGSRPSSSAMAPTEGPPDPHGNDPIPTNPPAPNTPTNLPE